MTAAHLKMLQSPATGLPFKVGIVTVQEGDPIVEGVLVDETGTHVVPIRNSIPRFVENSDYAENFAQQWNKYRQVQIDRENNFALSAERFYHWTGWKKEELNGALVLEIGCGAGRFTQVMLDAGAHVYAFDLSGAVEACWQTNKDHPNLCVFQADCRQIPCVPESFDYVFFYGVVQHTPDPEAAFQSAVRFLKPGGKISLDCYAKLPFFCRWHAKYLWRPLTSRMSPATLLKVVEWYVPLWLPFDTFLSRLPWIGEALVSFIPCWNYRDIFRLNWDQVRQWAVLDTFDALGARYDLPQTAETVRSWFEAAGLSNIQVVRGSNGIVGNAIKLGSAPLPVRN